MTLRQAHADDLPDLLGLYRVLNSDDVILAPEAARTAFAAMLAHPGLFVFIETDAADRAIATATLVVIPNLTRAGRPYGLIENVVSAPAHRGRGHGRAVVTHAIDSAWQAGCYKVMLLTGSSNPGVHRFYKACGFRQDKTGYQIRQNS